METSSASEILNTESEKNPLTFKTISLVYGSMIFCSLFWLYFRGRLAELHTITIKPLEAIGIGFLFALGVVALSWIITFLSHSFRLFMGCFQLILGELSFPMIFWIAFWSGIAEEITFRGMIQPSLGIFWTSLLFGCCHVPMNKVLLPWTIFALLAGLGLGYLQNYTQNLLAPISAHFTINFLNLYFLNSLKLSPEERLQIQEKIRLLPR